MHPAHPDAPLSGGDFQYADSREDLTPAEAPRVISHSTSPTGPMALHSLHTRANLHSPRRRRRVAKYSRASRPGTDHRAPATTSHQPGTARRSSAHETAVAAGTASIGRS